MERNKITKFPVLELNKVNNIVRVHPMCVYINSAKVRFYPLPLAIPHITMGTDYPLT